MTISGVHRTRVEWVDTDASGIHHNTAIVRYAEAAEAALMRDRGVVGYFPVSPRVHYDVDFASPLRHEQEVTTTVTLEHLGARSMAFAFEVWGEAFEGRPRRLSASGRYVTAHVPVGAERSAPWPPEWVAALGDSVPPNPVMGGAGGRSMRPNERS